MANYTTSYSTAQAAGRTPGTITAARVLAWIQVVFLAIMTVLAIAAAAAVNSATDAANSDTGTTMFSGIGDVAVGVIAVFIILFAAMTLAVSIPVARLKPGRPNPPIVLTVVEGLLAILMIVGLAESSDSSDVPVIALLICLLVIVLLWTPTSRAYSQTAPAMTTPAGRWAADPWGRHQYRWHDGNAWTTSVSTKGVQAIDPVV